MSIFRENFLEEGFFKKKKKDSLLFTNEEYEKFKEHTTKKLKELISKYNRDPEIKKEMRDRLDKEIKKARDEDGLPNSEITREFDGFDKNRKVPVLLSEIEEEGKAEIIYLIYDGSQTVRANVVIYIIEKIIKELKEDSLLKDKFNYINSGDGDEGCIYILFK